jgi:thiol-disulfide isomerase/thioredoxin
MILVVRIVAIAALGVLVACGRGNDGAIDGGPSTLRGAPAASYEVKRTDGAADSLADHRGSIVVMNLWATWCPPCREEMPALQRFYRAYASRGVVVLGIDQGEGARTAAAFAKDRGVTFPILADEDQRYGGTYKSVGLPTTIVVDRAGKIVRGIDGPVSDAQLSAIVDPLLARK